MEWNKLDNNPTVLQQLEFGLGGAGTQTAALAFGGYTGSPFSTATEEWTGPGTPVTKTITTS
jgi:hypothetical protein